MQGRGESTINEFYHVQVTPQRYVIQNEENVFTYQLLQKINANSVSLTSFSIINAFQNINQYYNRLTVSIGSQLYTVFMPQSTYSFWDINDMLTQITTQMNAQIPGAAFAMTLTGNNNKFVQVTNNNPFQFIYASFINYNQLTSYLGFGNGYSTAFTTQSATQTAEFPYSVQVTSSINVQLLNLSMNTETFGVVAQIPLNASITSQVQYQSSYYQQNRHILVKKGTMAIQNLVIALLDDNGNKLSIQNNKMALTLYFEQFDKS